MELVPYSGRLFPRLRMAKPRVAISPFALPSKTRRLSMNIILIILNTHFNLAFLSIMSAVTLEKASQLVLRRTNDYTLDSGGFL